MNGIIMLFLGGLLIFCITGNIFVIIDILRKLFNE